MGIDDLINAAVGDILGTINKNLWKAQTMGVGHAPWYRTAPYERIEYIIKAHYKFFPFLWYDVVKDRWWTDGTHAPMQDKTVVKARVSKATADGFVKLLKD